MIRSEFNEPSKPKAQKTQMYAKVVQQNQLEEQCVYFERVCVLYVSACVCKCVFVCVQVCVCVCGVCECVFVCVKVRASVKNRDGEREKKT